MWTHTHRHTLTGWFQCEGEHISHHPNTTLHPPLATTPSQQVSNSPLSNSCQITISQTRHPPSPPTPPPPPPMPLPSFTSPSSPPLSPPVSSLFSSHSVIHLPPPVFLHPVLATHHLLLLSYNSTTFP